MPPRPLTILAAAALAAASSSSAIAAQSASGPKPPTALTVASATAKAVSLSWTPGDPTPKFIVERKPAGAAWPAAGAAATPPKPTAATLAIAETPKASDEGIDPFATYVYRVRAVGDGNALSAPSNEVTVGPPPVGYSQVLKTPATILEHERNDFAAVIRMAFDANGDPAFAYLVSDPNADGEYPDSELDFVSWNRAGYRWNAPVKLDVVGDVVRDGGRPPFSLARDAATNRWSVAYLVGARELKIASSTDDGRTWTSVRVEKSTDEEPAFSTPSLALAGGQAYLAYALGGPGVRYRTGAETDPPDRWSKAFAPLLPNTSEARAEAVNVVLDAAGKPAVSYLLNPTENYNLTLALWRPGSASAVKILDTNNKQTDAPAGTLIASGTHLAVVFYGNRDEKFFDNHHVWFTQSTDGGATWSPVAVLEDDGGHVMVAPVSVTMDRGGHFAAAADLGGGNQDAVKCGLPNLMRSATGAQWTTCAPGTKGISPADPAYPLVAFAGNDKLYMVFRVRQPASGLVPALVIWREP